jgi:chromosome segregation ATPase
VSRITGEPVGYTCPLVDACKDEVEALAYNVDCATEFDECSVEQLKNLHGAWEEFDWTVWEQRMEEIRDANSQLRSWGEDSQTAIEELEKELEEAREEADTLRGQVRDLEADVERLEDKW